MKRALLALLLNLVCACAWADTSRLDAILDGGSLRICTTGDYAPFTLQKADGSFEGIDIDLANALAKALGVRAQFVKTTWPTLMDDFLAHCDIAMGGISVTLERMKKAGYTEAHMIDGKSAIARCADTAKFQTLDDIDRETTRAIVNPGGTNERFDRATLKAADIVVFPDNSKIFDELAAGRGDVMITDSVETRLQQKLNPALCAIHPDRPFDFGELAYLLPRDPVLKAWIDQWLHIEAETGDYAKLTAKWLE